MRTLFVAACVLFAIPALLAAPAEIPAPPSGVTTMDWEQQADAVIGAMKGRMKLTDDQAGKIRPILVSYLPKVRQLFDSYAGEGIETAPALLDQFRQARATFKDDLDPILNEAQKKEFLVMRKEVDQEIQRQFVDARLGWFRRELGLNDAQLEQARPLVADNLRKRLEILSFHSDSKGNPTQAGRALWPELEKVQKETDNHLRAVFTPAQMDTYLASRNKKAGAA